MIKYDSHEISSHILSEEGADIVQRGSHEARVWGCLPMRGAGPPMTLASLKEEVGEDTAKVGQGRAFKSGWIGKEGNGFVKLVSPKFQLLSTNKNSISSRYQKLRMLRK